MMMHFVSFALKTRMTSAFDDWKVKQFSLKHSWYKDLEVTKKKSYGDKDGFMELCEVHLHFSYSVFR